MNTKIRIIGINLLLFALLFGLVSLNKGFLRPFSNQTPPLTFLTGSFPNFIAAYLISLFFVNAVVTIEPQNGRLIVYMGSLFVFVVLTIEELNSFWGASTHYDPIDIIASGLGSLLAVLTFELIVLKRKKQKMSV